MSPGNRGDEALRLGHLNEAIRAYRAALALEPDSAWYHQSLGEVSARKGWFLVASGCFRRALQLDPDAVARWYLVHTPAYATDTAVPEPVFVLGCQHSGTTILTRLLANHPRVMLADARETNLFAGSADDVNATLRGWDQACTSTGASRWVEKSVLHAYMVPKLLAARPAARFVIIVRDGRDVVASLKARKYAFNDLDDLIYCWTRVTDVLQRLVARPGTVLIRYEDLVRDPEATLTAVCTAIGEAWTPQMLQQDGTWLEWYGLPRMAEAGEAGSYRSHQRLRTWQINQPLFDGSGRWRTGLTAGEQQRFKALAQRHLEAFGYADSDGW